MLRFIKNFLLKATGKKLTPEKSSIMSELEKIKKYKNVWKKRKWEERRSDYVASGSSEVSEEKKLKSDNVDRVKRRKYTLLLGYSGANYYGMQRNPYCKSIEEDLITAMFKAKLITQEAYEQAYSIHFQRAARTDKGVSAIRQIVSLKMPETFDVEEINQHLPSEIRVFGAERVTKGFNCKNQCDARTYAYMLPTIALAPFSENPNQEEYRVSPEILETVNKLLQTYVGTKNYHNFTCKKKPTDPSANRYIMSFVCESPFIRENVEFAIMKVKGQSFMMHQIRKMIGLVIAICKGHVTEDAFNKAFSLEKLNIPRAPGLGLMLEFVHYDRYNNRYGSDGMHNKLLWEKENEKVNCFAEEYIFPNIINTEIGEKPMLTWLQKLSRHKFDSPQDEEEEEANEEGDDEDEEQKENECNEDEKYDLRKQSVQ